MTNPFELQSELGRGGMGVVWRARDTQSGQTVAIKLMHEQYAREPDYVARLQREVEVSRRIQSPRVVKVLGYGVRGSVPYMVMEYVPGQSLRELVHGHGPLTWAQAKPILRQVAEGLDSAGRVGVLHRDVKPSNIIITPDGQAKLADFGIARAFDMSRLTRSSTMMGTPHYMAPEGQRDVRSDMYSLGCVLYEMLTGARPFEGTNPHDVIVQHMRAVPDMSRVPDGQPRALVAWMMQKDPSRRPGNAAALLAALDGSTRIPSRPISVGSNRLIPIVVAALVPLALVGAATGMFFALSGGGGGPDQANASLLATQTAEASKGPSRTSPTLTSALPTPSGTTTAGTGVSATPTASPTPTSTPTAPTTIPPSTGGGGSGNNGGGGQPVDTDHDGVPDPADNCPAVPNPNQSDVDGDRVGDACDSFDNRDPDGDGVPNGSDLCQNVYARTANGCPSDRDGDGVVDISDNCPDTPNANQSDVDGDGIGDACDSFDNRDPDGDGIPSGSDQCPNQAGPAPSGCPLPDRDHDGVPDNTDQCPDTAGDPPTGCPAYQLNVSLNQYQFSPGDTVHFCYSLAPHTPFALYAYKAVNGGPKELLLSLNDDGFGDCFEATMGSDGQREYTVQAVIGGSVVATRIAHANVGPGMDGVADAGVAWVDPQ